MLDLLGNIGDFVGGIGGVITLIYLARQIKQNSASIEATAVQAATSSVADALDSISRDTEVAALYVRGCNAFASQSTAEKLQYSILMGSILHRFEGLLVIRDRGLVPASAMDGAMNRVRDAFRQEGTLEWWARSKGLFNPMLRDWIEGDVIGKSPGR